MQCRVFFFSLSHDAIVVILLVIVSAVSICGRDSIAPPLIHLDIDDVAVVVVVVVAAAAAAVAVMFVEVVAIPIVVALVGVVVQLIFNWLVLLLSAVLVSSST